MHCRIRTKGHLDRSWQRSLEKLYIVQEANGTSLLSGMLKDQAALYGVLLKIRSLSLTLLSLETSEESEDQSGSCFSCREKRRSTIGDDFLTLTYQAIND